MDMFGALLAKSLSGGGGSNVVPNPEGEATATLNKIGINDTIYNFEKELPETTSADAGDVLTVNNNGDWVKAAPSGGDFVVYDADRETSSGNVTLTLKNNKKISNIIQDINNAKAVAIRASGLMYYLVGSLGQTIDFIYVRYYSSGNEIQIGYATGYTFNMTGNTLSGGTIKFAPPSST